MSGLQTTFTFVLCLINIFILTGGHVPPGVNPNHYQQQDYQQAQYQPPPPAQQYQQPPPPPQQQYQQPAPPPPPQQQQQQPPPQQQLHQQPPPQQHQNVPQAHGHHHHSGEPQLLNTANIAQEREHIQEHLDVPIDTSKMTEKELHYHYFTMHDADKNNKLDGCELIKSLIHWHEQGKDPQTGQQPQPDKLFKDDELVALIDPILAMDDANGDGYIDYPEFIKAQMKASKNQPRP